MDEWPPSFLCELDVFFKLSQQHQCTERKLYIINNLLKHVHLRNDANLLFLGRPSASNRGSAENDFTSWGWTEEDCYCRQCTWKLEGSCWCLLRWSVVMPPRVVGIIKHCCDPSVCLSVCPMPLAQHSPATMSETLAYVGGSTHGWWAAASAQYATVELSLVRAYHFARSRAIHYF